MSGWICALAGLFLLLTAAAVDGAAYPLLLLAAAGIHEGGHLLAALLCRIPLRTFRSVPGGFRLTYDVTAVSYRRETVMILAGPLAGLLAAALCPLTGDLARPTTFFFFAACVGMSLGNLLPAPPLDGGALLSCVLTATGHGAAVPAVLRAGGAAVGSGVFLAALAVQVFCGGNLSLLALSVWLLVRMETGKPDNGCGRTAVSAPR